MHKLNSHITPDCDYTFLRVCILNIKRKKKLPEHFHRNEIFYINNNIYYFATFCKKSYYIYVNNLFITLFLILCICDTFKLFSNYLQIRKKIVRIR